MSKLKIRKPLLIILLSLVLLSFVVYPVKADGNNFVIANTKDWRSIYITGIYATFMDAELIYISNLFDAQLASNRVSSTSNIIVFESNTGYVVKNYQSFLQKNGHQDVETVSFDGYLDLQSSVFEDLDTKGLFILNPEYGGVAVVATPYILKNRYAPFFVDSDNKNDARSLGGKNVIIVGRIPAKITEDLKGEKILYSPFRNIDEVTKLVLEDNQETWGLITKIDEIDPTTLQSKLPVFLFMGDKYLGNLVDIIDESNINNFEVIGASMNDVARRIDVSTARDLKMMLKFGMLISSGEGGFQSQSDVQNLNTIFFDYPIENLEAKSATYYPNIERLGITFKNEGNIDVMFFSTVDFQGDTIAERDVHHIQAGQTKTIPFEFSGDFNGKDAKMNTRYGVSFPLLNPIETEENQLYFSIATKESDHYEDMNVTLAGYGYDYTDDKLILDLKNPNPNDLIIFAELKLDEEKVRTSKVSTISQNKKGRLEIETPYTRTDEISNKFFNVTVYFGEIDTLNSIVFELEMKEYAVAGEFTYYLIIGAILVVIILLIILIKKKKDKEKTKKSK